MQTAARRRPRQPGRRETNRPAFTLVEVIAGVALLGTLLVGLMLGFSKHVRQYHAARLRIQAIEKLDRQLELWYSAENDLPMEGQGLLSAEPPLTWRSSMFRSPQAAQLNSTLIRIEVVRTDRTDSERPLIAVELLHPLRAIPQPPVNP